MTNTNKYKDKLATWDADPKSVTPATIEKWHKGKIYHYLPTKLQLRKEGMAAIAKGWLPDSPIITPDMNVLAVGSCFASHFTLWLAENGFNRAFPDSPYNALLRFGSHFESPAVIAQQFRWAFDELDPSTLLWIDKNRHLVDPTDMGKQTVRSTLETADVLILTLGLSEVWYDKVSGEPLWRALTEGTFDPERHVFRVETMSQTLKWLGTIEQLRRQRLPNLKIVFTISPIPLKTTFRPVSAITANSVSKAILRSALDEFLRQNKEVLNKELFYFPSYEFVTSYFVDPFGEDNRHLAQEVPARIINFFVSHYCEKTCQSQSTTSRSFSVGKSIDATSQEEFIMSENDQIYELIARISDLENKCVHLQQICDDRQHVIDGLKQAADERLELINKLDRERKGRQ